MIQRGLLDVLRIGQVPEGLRLGRKALVNAERFQPQLFDFS